MGLLVQMYILCTCLHVQVLMYILCTFLHLDSIIPLVSIFKISRLQLVSVAWQAALLVANPEDKFSRDGAHMSHITRKPIFGSLRPGKTQIGLLCNKD